MSSPFISVVMPVHNAEKYLVEAVESIFAQTFQDFEFIIIDDGSTDGTLAILEKYQQKDERIRLFSRENRGLVPTLNEGLAYTRGKYVARMDADDISLPDRFRAQLDYLEKNQDCVAVGTQVLIIDPEGMPICPFSTCLSHEDIDGAHLLLKGGAITHPSVMMRKETVVSAGGYRPECIHAEDLDLFLRLAEIGRLANLAECLLLYRMHYESIGNSKRGLQLKSAFNALVDAHGRRKLPPPDDANFVLEKTTSRVGLHRKWAWWALGAGNKQTARKHALIAFRHSPFSWGSFKLLACTLRGY